jgi:hypothetical protein
MLHFALRCAFPELINRMFDAACHLLFESASQPAIQPIEDERTGHPIDGTEMRVAMQAVCTEIRAEMTGRDSFVSFHRDFCPSMNLPAFP